MLNIWLELSELSIFASLALNIARSPLLPEIAANWPLWFPCLGNIRYLDRAKLLSAKRVLAAVCRHCLPRALDKRIQIKGLSECGMP
ncbi:hypothetical protein BpHYR1_008831 [Brachionus plicatilis]|uniref:Uncharacterized protein n=1 Tax=Brachionus plicatilis TaxID=10195 RepID=A0A3M7R7L4_BRAPC|nr:hypothetical protein BpHYR1_008831 [Brachionus plicatilis]